MLPLYITSGHFHSTVLLLFWCGVTLHPRFMFFKNKILKYSAICSPCLTYQLILLLQTLMGGGGKKQASEYVMGCKLIFDNLSKTLKSLNLSSHIYFFNVKNKTKKWKWNKIKIKAHKCIINDYWPDEEMIKVEMPHQKEHKPVKTSQLKLMSLLFYLSSVFFQWRQQHGGRIRALIQKTLRWDLHWQLQSL